MNLIMKVFRFGMNRLKEWSREALLTTLFYNYISPHVKRLNGGKLIIYKQTKLYFEKNTKLVIENGVLKIGGGKPFGAKNPSLIRLQENSVFHAYGNNSIEYNADILLKPNAEYVMKKNSYINCKCIIRCAKYISIGENCIIGTELNLRDGDGHELNGVIKNIPTIIGNHVWIGARVTILKGVTISAGSMIGACSLVTHDIPEKSLAYGIPAHVKKRDINWVY